MVNVVVPRNSVHALVNLALTMKELGREGKKARYQLVDEEQTNTFWKNLPKYVDRNDMSVIILDIPHPEFDALKQIALEPWKSVILYVPSELNAPNREERELMMEKGISVVPPRKTYESFLGDISSQNEMWRNFSKILSMEERGENIDEKELYIVKGIIEVAITSPRDAIDHIMKDSVDYFHDVGSKHRQPDFVLHTPSERICFVEVKRMSPKFYGNAFETYMKCNVDPIGIYGAMNAIFTIKPTFCMRLGEQETKEKVSKKKFSFLTRFGKGAIIGFSGQVDRSTVGYFSGICQRPQLLLKVSAPKFVTQKTLRRRLLGGKTSEKIEGERYEKRYRGLAEHFSDLKFLTEDTLLVPEDAFENTIALLHRSGANYQLLATPVKRQPS